MRRFGAFGAGLTVFLMLAAGLGVAQSAPKRVCCYVPAGTLVEVSLVSEVSTKTQKTGDSFALQLAEPIVVGGRMVVRAGTHGEGVIIEASKPGMGGKPAKLVLAARYLSVRGQDLAIEGLQLSGGGHNNAMAAQAVGLTGIAFAPLGFVGLAVQGGDVTFPAGTTAVAKLTNAITLPSIGRAPPGAAAAVAAAAAQDEDLSGAIDIPPPPAGQGQVVFFRPRSLLGTAQWFNVRENGLALGKLSNGAYFIDVTTPGIHTYTAVEEPELKDKLKVEVDPGETYFVEGELSKGVVLSAADLEPSDRATFDKSSKGLKLASAASGATASAEAASGSSAAEASAVAVETPSAAPAPAVAPAGSTMGSSDPGYAWAKQNNIVSASSCPADPSAYRAGCLAYVADEAAAPAR